MKANIFEMIKDNEALFDERVSKEYAQVEWYLFAFIRIIFMGAVFLGIFNLNDIGYKILYNTFFVIFWIEPLVFSMRGLWNSAKTAIMTVISGCIVALILIYSILQFILSPSSIWGKLIIIFIGIICAIGSYFLYTFSYARFIKMQEIE